MRVLVPRRIVGFCLLIAVLCAIPAMSPPSYAKPIGWDSFPDEDNPPGPKGDGDGVVVKAGSIQWDQTASSTVVTSGRVTVWSLMGQYLRFVRLGYGSLWYR